MNSWKAKEILPVVAIAGLIVLFFYGMGSALVPLLFSYVFAYASFPLVKKLEARGLKRSQATLVVLGSLTVILMVLALILLPPLIEELQAAIMAAPESLSVTLNRIDEVLSHYGIHVPYDRASLQQFIGEYSQKISSDFVASGVAFVKNSIANFASLLVILLSFAMVPVFFFYVITDSDKIRKFIYNIIPQDWQKDTEEFLDRADKILSGYVRGQLLVCAILSVMYTVALLIVDVKFALIIGVATGVLSVIPYIGYSMGFAMAVFSVLANHDGWGQLLALIVAYSLVQFIESFIITPKIVGNEVGLTPFEAILALIIIGNIFGFIGLFFAIPMGGIIKLLIRKLMISYKRTEFYRA